MYAFDTTRKMPSCPYYIEDLVNIKNYFVLV